MSEAVVLAADIGATSMRAALVDGSGRLLARRQVPTEPAQGFEAATDRLARALHAASSDGGLAPAALGISTAGPLDPATGTYRNPPNLPGWNGRSMRPALSAGLGIPVVVGHDATLAALAETRFGHRRGATDLLYLTVSTGIGAGIVAGGRAVTGASGGAGEVGHMIVNPGGPSCGAGCPGCLEGASSGAAIAGAADRAVEAGEPTTLHAGATAEAVFAAAAADDRVARRIVDEAARHLASGLAGLLAIFDPEVIVVGGGAARGFAASWEALLEATRQRALPRYAAGVPVEQTTLGDDASLLGAALIAFEAVDR